MVVYSIEKDRLLREQRKRNLGSPSQALMDMGYSPVYMHCDWSKKRFFFIQLSETEGELGRIAITKEIEDYFPEVFYVEEWPEETNTETEIE